MKKAFKTFITIISVVLILGVFTAVSASAANKIAAPKSVKAASTTSSVTLTWSKVKKADYYRVYYKTSKDAKWKTAVKKTTATKKVLKELPSGKKYYFAVRSYDKTKNGTVYSERKEVQIATKPAKTKKITATPKIKQVTLKWNTVKGATHYRVYQKINGEWKSLTLTEKTSFTVKNLKASTKYTFAVRAYVKTKSYSVAGARKAVTVTTKAKEPDNYITKTDGGVKLYPITSAEAKAIYNKWGYKFIDYYEGKSSSGKTLIFTEDAFGWNGIDINGATHDEFGNIRKCPYCGKTMGRGNNMCNGCNISWQ